MLESINYSEVSITVPWGHVSGRWYGDQMERPILAIHGWQDNCGTFAKLAPLIAPYRSILCIDVPGHGRSSHLPPGILYHNTEYVRTILRIMQAYKWETVSLLGHSMGASICFYFAAFYPDRVDMVISLDIIKNNYWTPENYLLIVGQVTEKCLTENDRLLNENRPEPPRYTFEECEKLLHKASYASIDLPNCKYILERNTMKSDLYPDKYYFSRDSRIKQLCEMYPNTELSLEMAKRICKLSLPYLVVKGGKSRDPSSKPTQLDEFMQNNNKNFECQIYPPGTHHLHLNDPKPVAQIIISFLQKFNNPTPKLVQSKI